MKSERLLSSLLLLQAHGRMSERQIAERLEISQRTAHRDMEALCAAGIPLIALRGVRGGWELEKGWRTRVPGLDDSELWGLLMAQPGSPGDRRMTAAARRAFEKLLASMPQAMQAQAASIRARLHIDPTGWRPTMEDWSMLPLVQEALARDCRLSFLYTRADGQTSTRTVDPLGLVSKQAAWYLVARNTAGMRTYRVSRMKDAVVLALPCERPAGFDLASYWKRSTEALRAEKQRFTATLALAPEAAAALREWATMRPVANHTLARKGWAVFLVDFESASAARFVSLGLGANAAVLGPEELRQEVAGEIKRMAGMGRVQRTNA
jgi:predicted DNA-binding transcriptional regulator YafY